MDDVRVHYNSSKPAQLQAHAYAQGTNIHLASGQEKHLPHEAWHVVQQKQGRVKPTMQMKGKVNINDDEGLEREADVMGSKAMSATTQRKAKEGTVLLANQLVLQKVARREVVQRFKDGGETEAAALEKLPEGPDAALRKRAQALFRKAENQEERDRVKRLVDKFSKPEKEKGPSIKTVTWSPEHEAVSNMLYKAQTKVFEAAEKVGKLESRESKAVIKEENG